jgi:hypothetical protein
MIQIDKKYLPFLKIAKVILESIEEHNEPKINIKPTPNFGKNSTSGVSKLSKPEPNSSEIGTSNIGNGVL